MLLENLAFLAGSVLTAFQLFLLCYTIYLGVQANFRHHSISLRLTVFITGCYWLPAAIFAVLIPFGLFDRIWTTGLLLACAIGSWLALGRNLSLKTDWFRLISHGNYLWQSLSWPARTAGIALLIVTTIRSTRGLIAPPLSWDALTYHLLKAGRWVQSGGWVWEKAPDSWMFYEYFPPLGDVYWAWTMLGTHTDAWLALTNLLIYITCAVSIYALARSLGANPERSFLATVASVSVPAILTFVTASYVDNTALALVTAGSALVIGAVKARDNRLASVAIVAMALSVGIKITFLPYLLVALAALVYSSTRQLGSVWLYCSTAIGMFSSLAWQITLIFLRKTPFYPAPFSILGYEIEAGQPEFIKHHYEVDFWLPYMWEMPQSFLKFLVYEPFWLPDHLNMTWTFPVVLLVGIVAFYILLKKLTWPLKITLALLFLAGFLIFATFWSPSTAFYRGIWIYNMGRFFISWYVLLIVLCLAVASRKVIPVFYGITAVSLVISWPSEWVRLDYLATAIGVAIVAGVAGTSAYIYTRRNHILVTTGLTAILVIAAVAAVYNSRDRLRYVYYQNADEVQDILSPGSMGFPGGAAEWLDKHSKIKISYSTAYHGIVYSWFRYVFLGSHLQNEVVYITPTKDGTIWSPSITPKKKLDYQSWKQRLIASDVDYFVSLYPYPNEIGWINKHRDDFQIIKTGPDKNWVIVKLASH